MAHVRKRLTTKERFGRTLERKFRRLFSSSELSRQARTYYTQEYEDARRKTNTVIKSAEVVARKVKKERLRDIQLVLVGRASRPLYRTLRQASEKLGLKRENIKLLDVSTSLTPYVKDDRIYGRVKGQKAFADYMKRISIGVGEKPKPVMIIDAAGITGMTANVIADALERVNPKMTPSNTKVFCLGLTKEEIILKEPAGHRTQEEIRRVERLFEYWPHSVEPVFKYVRKGRKAKPVYKAGLEIDRLRAWIYEQARQHKVKEWLKRKK